MANSSSSEFKVTQPLFFRISYNNKVAYLLGTNHLFSAAVLPQELHAIKDNCSGFVAESTDASIAELEEFKHDFLKLYGRRPQDNDWFQELTALQQELTQVLFDLFLEQYYDDYAPDVAVKDVRLAIVIDYVGYALRPLLADLFDAALIDENMDSDVVLSGIMDLELAATFNDIYPLEDHFLWTKLVAEDSADVEDLKAILAVAAAFGSDDDDEIVIDLDEEDVDELQEAWNRYRDGEHLTDFEFVTDCEQYDANENYKMQKRNLVMFSNMLKLITEKAGPLFMTTGAEHLIGSHGLLMLLANNDIKVELFDPNHNGVELFQPYNYRKAYFELQEKAAQPLYFRVIAQESNKIATDIFATADITMANNVMEDETHVAKATYSI